jgi:hypothetical protein
VVLWVLFKTNREWLLFQKIIVFFVFEDSTLALVLQLNIVEF